MLWSINTQKHTVIPTKVTKPKLKFYMLGDSILEHMLCYRYQKDLSIAFMWTDCIFF